MKSIPLLVQFIGTMVIVIISIEFGYRAGRILHRWKKNEKEGMVSVISGSILGLLAFILAFTFGMVSDRYAARKSLIREEANQIGTVWLRTDFMPEPDRSESRKLLKKYVGLRIDLLESVDDDHVLKAIEESSKVQVQLWSLAGKHSQTDMRSDIGALYYDALNILIDIQGSRVAVAYQGHIPPGLWMSLYVLLILGMLSVGYYGCIVESKKNFGAFIMALSFSLVIWIISNLDQLQSNYFRISQQPLIDMQVKMGSQ
ncbi:MAG: bestrophin-like domain [Flavisolibacter sp.]